MYYSSKEKSDVDTTIRVRIKYNHITLQLKELISKKDGIHIKNEYEKTLQEIPYRISGEELSLLSGFKKYDDSYLQGILVTHRKEIKIGNNIVALDFNQYCGKKDYEIEIEFEDSIEMDLLNYLESNEICYEEKSCGKYTRFLKEYNNTEV